MSSLRHCIISFSSWSRWSFKRQIQTSSCLWAGHSKWANIKHIKAEKDGQKAELYARYSRQIQLAILEGNSADVNLNSRLRYVVEDALKKSMPMSTIQNVIKKSEKTEINLKKYRLDLRYRQNIFLVCNIYTDNYAAVKMAVMPILKKHGVNIIPDAYQFEDFGLIETIVPEAHLQLKEKLEEQVTDDAILCGAEEVEICNADSGAVNFICSAEQMGIVRCALEKAGYTITSGQHIFTPKQQIQLQDSDRPDYEKFMTKLLSVPGLDDVYDNIERDES